jgi:hypothetical protein
MIQHLPFFGQNILWDYLIHWMIAKAIFDNRAQLRSYFLNEKVGFVIVVSVYCGVTLALAAILHYVLSASVYQNGQEN